MKGRVQCLLISFALAMVNEAKAEVRVELPPACGSPVEFQEELGALIGEEEARSLTLTMRIDALSGGGYRLVLTTADWSRELQDAECPALFRAALVVVAASVEQKKALPASGDSNASLGGAAVEGASKNEENDGSIAFSDPNPSESERPSARSDAQEESTSAPQQPVAPVPLEGFLAVAGGAQVGLAPKTRPIVSVGGGFRWGMWGANVDFRFNPRKDAWISAERGVRFGAVGLRVAGSWDPTDLFHLVFGVSLARIDATGLGLRDPQSDHIYLPSIELEGQLQPWRSRHWGFELALRGRYGLTTPRFVIEPETVIYEVPRLGGALLFRGLCFF